MIQDRFRFRVWYKRNWDKPIMLYDAELAYDYMRGEPESIPVESFGEILEDEMFVVMQCTGLKDKNGKLIYEGDVVYKKGSKNWKNEKLLSKVIWSSDSAAFMISDENGLHQMPMNSNNIEILGNIYENPELLKGDR